MPTVKVLTDLTNDVAYKVDVTGLVSGDNITTRIQSKLALIPSGGTVVIPTGSWTITNNTIALKSHQHIVGEPGAEVIAATTGTAGQKYLFGTETNSRHTSIKNLVFTAPSSAYKLYIAGLGAKFIHISDIRCVGGTLFRCGTTVYADMGPTTQVEHIVIERCYGEGNDSTSGETYGQRQFIYMLNAYHFTIRDCSLTDGQYLLQLQGGGPGIIADAGNDGKTGEKKAGYGLVERCHASNVGANIFLAMAKDVIIRDCTGFFCSDLAFDAEGCADCDFIRCHAIDPGATTSASNSGKTGACFGLYWSGENIRFIDCIGEFVTTTTSAESPTTGQTVLAYGGGQGSYFFTMIGAPEPTATSLPYGASRFTNIKLVGCHFRAAAPCKDGRFARISNFRVTINDGNPWWDPIIESCKFKNGTIQLGYDRDKYSTVRDNTFEFFIASYVTDYAIRLAPQNYFFSSAQSDGAFMHLIEGNVIRYHIAQPNGSAGIAFINTGALVNWQNYIYLYDNKITTVGAMIESGFYIRNGNTGSGGGWIVRGGDNIVPSSYINSGQPLIIDDTSATRPTYFFTTSSNVTHGNGTEVGLYSVTTRPSALVPVTVSGTNKFEFANGATGAATLTESGLQVGDQVVSAGITTSANNGTWLVSAITNTGTGASSGECSITVTKLDGTGAGLTNETVAGTPTLQKQVRRGQWALIRDFSPSGINTGNSVIANTGIAVGVGSTYRVINTNGAHWVYDVVCEAANRLRVYALNRSGVDATPPTSTTISIVHGDR